MRLLFLAVCLVLSVQGTTVAVAPEQQCLESFVGLTQDWFRLLSEPSLATVDRLLDESMEWGRDCGEMPLEESASLEENQKVQGFFACLRTLRSLPGELLKLGQDLMGQDSVQIALDAYSLFQSMESLVLNCGL